MARILDFAGWRFQSDFAIPGAVAVESATEAAADIVITGCPVPPAGGDGTGHPVWKVAPAGQVQLDLPGIGRFLIAEGCRVAVAPAPAANLHTIGFLLGGPVLAVLLRQRGLLPVDGAALGWETGALLLAGPSGQGKSLLAAALARKGWPVLGDGVLAVAPSASQPALIRCWPRLRLWQCGARTLGIDISNYPPLRPGEARVDTIWPEVGRAPSLITGLVIVLNRASAPRCERISPAQAVTKLAQSVWSRPAYADTPDGAAALMRDLVSLARGLPCWLLTPGEGLEAVGATADRLLETVSRPEGA